MPRSLPEIACMRSGRIGHTVIEPQQTTTDRGSHVSRPPRATPSLVTVPTPPGRGGGASGLRSVHAGRMARSSTSPTSTIRGSPTTATSASRRGAWGSSGRRGSSSWRATSPSRRCSASPVRACGRSSSPTPHADRYARRRRARVRAPQPRDRAAHRRALPPGRAGLGRPAGAAVRRASWRGRRAGCWCSRRSTTTRTSAPCSATRRPSGWTAWCSTPPPPTRSTGGPPGCRSGTSCASPSPGPRPGPARSTTSGPQGSRSSP